MSPKRLDDVAAPVVDDEWRIRYANSESVAGWRELCGKAAANARRAYDVIRMTPRPPEPNPRHHQLKRDLAFVVRDGARMEHWQYEVTGGGRLWYHIDDAAHTVWLDYASVAHPKQTD